MTVIRDATGTQPAPGSWPYYGVTRPEGSGQY
jgi:hypothetical protein